MSVNLFRTSVPGPNALEAYRNVQPGAAETITQPLYDHLVYPATGISQLIFFQQPKGQGQSSHPGAVTGATKTLADTNLETPGALPRFKAFMVESIEVQFMPGSAVSGGVVYNSPVVAGATAVPATVQDAELFYNSGYLDWNISSKPYLQDGPLRKFIPSVQDRVYGAISGVNEAAVSFALDGNRYYLDAPLTLQDNQAFQVSLNWPVLVPITNPARVGVYLKGFTFRAQQ
jgi:hypothetical protein